MSDNNGGPAFPNLNVMSHFNGQPTYENLRGGMSLRDYFAAKAMIGICNNWSPVPSTIAELSYQLADAMLKERAK